MLYKPINSSMVRFIKVEKSTFMELIILRLQRTIKSFLISRKVVLLPKLPKQEFYRKSCHSSKMIEALERIKKSFKTFIIFKRKLVLRKRLSINKSQRLVAKKTVTSFDQAAQLIQRSFRSLLARTARKANNKRNSVENILRKLYKKCDYRNNRHLLAKHFAILRHLLFMNHQRYKLNPHNKGEELSKRFKSNLDIKVSKIQNLFKKHHYLKLSLTRLNRAIRNILLTPWKLRHINFFIGILKNAQAAKNSSRASQESFFKKLIQIVLSSKKRIKKETFGELVDDYQRKSSFEYLANVLQASTKVSILDKKVVCKSIHYPRLVRNTYQKKRRMFTSKWPVCSSIFIPLLEERISQHLKNRIQEAFNKINNSTEKSSRKRKEEAFKNFLDKAKKNVIKRNKVNVFENLKDLFLKEKAYAKIVKLSELVRKNKFNYMIPFLDILCRRLRAIDLLYTAKHNITKRSNKIAWVYLLKNYIFTKSGNDKRRRLFELFNDGVHFDYLQTINNYLIDSSFETKENTNQKITTTTYKRSCQEIPANILSTREKRNIYSFGWWNPSLKTKEDQKHGLKNSLSFIEFINKFVGNSDPVTLSINQFNFELKTNDFCIEKLMKNEKRFKRRCEVCIDKRCNEDCVCFCHELSSDEEEFSNGDDSNYLNNKKLQLTNVDNISIIGTNKSATNLVKGAKGKNDEEEEGEGDHEESEHTDKQEEENNIKLCLTRKQTTEEEDVDIDNVFNNFKKLKREKYDSLMKEQRDFKEKEDEIKKKEDESLDTSSNIRPSVKRNTMLTRKVLENSMEKDSKPNRNLLRKTMNNKAQQFKLRDCNDVDPYKEVMQGVEINRYRKATNSSPMKTNSSPSKQVRDR